MPANYNCLLFDVDGTLLDFNAAEREAIEATLQQFNLPFDNDTIELYSSINARLWAALEKGEIRKDKLATKRFSLLLQELGAKGDVIKMNNEYMTRLSMGSYTFPGAADLLDDLAEFATLAVVSNGIMKVQHRRLEKSGLLPYFDDVFVSERLGVTKPNPKFFDLALKKLGIKNKSRVLVIGDSLAADIKGGNDARLDTCWFNPGNAENTSGVEPTHTVQSYEQLKVIAVGEEALKDAATREKRHVV